MPSTMYTAISAVKISIGSEDSESWNAAAVPWKLPWMVAGMRICSSVCSISARRIAQRRRREQD